MQVALNWFKSYKQTFIIIIIIIIIIDNTNCEKLRKITTESTTYSLYRSLAITIALHYNTVLLLLLLLK